MTRHCPQWRGRQWTNKEQRTSWSVTRERPQWVGRITMDKGLAALHLINGLPTIYQIEFSRRENIPAKRFGTLMLLLVRYRHNSKVLLHTFGKWIMCSGSWQLHSTFLLMVFLKGKGYIKLANWDGGSNSQLGEPHRVTCLHCRLKLITTELSPASHFKETRLCIKSPIQVSGEQPLQRENLLKKSPAVGILQVFETKGTNYVRLSIENHSWMKDFI